MAQSVTVLYAVVGLKPLNLFVFDPAVVFDDDNDDDDYNKKGQFVNTHAHTHIRNYDIVMEAAIYEEGKVEDNDKC